MHEKTRDEQYVPPEVTDLGRLEDITGSGTMGGSVETGKT